MELKVGDICPDCRLDGIKSHLRNFFINLDEETLLKCESDTCMYPYNDDISSDSSLSSFADNKEENEIIDTFMADSLPAELTEFHARDTNKKPSKKRKSKLTQANHSNPNISMPNLLDMKEEPQMIYSKSQSHCKKPKLAIQSIKMIKKGPNMTNTSIKHSINKILSLGSTYKQEPITQFSPKPSTSNNPPLETKKAETITSFDGLPPKASLIKGRQFLDATSSPASGSFTTTGSSDRVITRSATCLALFGIALSSFSLKQMLATSGNKSTIPLRKF